MRTECYSIYVRYDNDNSYIIQKNELPDINSVIMLLLVTSVRTKEWSMIIPSESTIVVY